MYENLDWPQRSGVFHPVKKNFTSGWHRWHTPEYGNQTPGPAHFFTPLRFARAESIGVVYLVAERLCDKQPRVVDSLMPSEARFMHCEKCAKIIRRMKNGEASVLTAAFSTP